MFTDFPTEKEVIETWPNNHDGAVATFACLSYMHSPFILDTLRGFISQRTDFPFEIICYDDCSTDGTREKISAFAARYPKIVRTIFPETNQNLHISKPFFDIISPVSKGRYLACCEGDDYWTDPLKIQKQVDFLEDNPDYVIATHNIATIDTEGRPLNTDWLPGYYQRDFSQREVILAWSCVQIQSMLFRNVIREIPDEMRKAPSGDVFICSLLGHFGKAKYLADIKPSMYRQHGGGEFSTLSTSDRHDYQAMNFYWLYRYYKRIGHQREARVFRLRQLERNLREVSLSDFLRLLYLKIRPTRAMATLTTQRR